MPGSPEGAGDLSRPSQDVAPDLVAVGLVQLGRAPV
jgi:hypothetical protein